MKEFTHQTAFQSTGFRIESEEVKQIGRWRIQTTTKQIRDSRSFVFAKQIHSGNIVKARDLQILAVQADGIAVLANDRIKAGVITADCVPLVVINDNCAVLLHISRKSIVNGLLDNLATYIAPKEIDHIYAGPHICEFHFEFTDEDIYVRRFRSRFPQAVHFYKGKMYLSLKKAMQYFFDEWQVHPSRISGDGRCTYENSSLPSYRRRNANGGIEEIGSLYTVVWRED